PDPPTNVSLNWTSNNTLLVLWRHPNVTNGRLTCFTIIMGKAKSVLETFEKKIKSENDYSLVYSYEIKEHFFKSCYNYDIYIYAQNTGYWSNANKESVWSPPPIPVPIGDMESKSSTNYTIPVKIPSPPSQKIVTSDNSFYMFVSEYADRKVVRVELNAFEGSIEKGERPAATDHARLVLQTSLSDIPSEFVIGNNTEYNFQGRNFPNPPLEPGTKYQVHLFYVNRCGNKSRIFKNEYSKYTTGDPYLYVNPKEESHEPNLALYALGLLVLVIPLIIFM
ncbi:hypothetical protein NQ317_014641, partial [Molorchus minor]